MKLADLPDWFWEIWPTAFFMLLGLAGGFIFGCSVGYSANIAVNYDHKLACEDALAVINKCRHRLERE